jgi:di/tricarboxylate transporter
VDYAGHGLCACGARGLLSVWALGVVPEIEKMGSWSVVEKKAALLMALAILLWLTDFIHHISASVIGMGVGLFALLPRVGILDIEEMRRLNYLPVFFVAAAVSTMLERPRGSKSSRTPCSLGCSPT